MKVGDVLRALPGVRVAFAAVVLSAGTSDAAAQDLSLSSALDAAGDGIYMVFTEPAVRFGRESGLQPVVSLGAYVARVDGDNSVGFAPAVAVRYGRPWGSIMGKLGWGRSSTTTVGAGAPTMMMSRVSGPSALKTTVPTSTMAAAIADDVFGGDDGGLNTSLQVDLSGDDAWGLQGVASYSWGADVLWGRGRVTRMVSVAANGRSVALGAEFVWQAQTDDGDLLVGNEYRAIYLGPVIRIARAGGTVWSVSGGLKRPQPIDEGTWYAKLELTIDP